MCIRDSVKGALYGMHPAVVGLIAAAALSLACLLYTSNAQKELPGPDDVNAFLHTGPILPSPQARHSLPYPGLSGAGV